MPDLATFDDLFRVGRDEILLRSSSISREAVEREGMDANALIAAAASAGDEVVGQVGDLEAALFLDSAPGVSLQSTALDRLLFDRYQLVRKPASAGITSAVFSTLTPSPTTFPIPVGAVLQTNSGIQYVTTESSIFPIGSEGPIVVMARSSLAGLSQAAAAGSLSNIITAISGAPSNLAVTNPLASTGTDDAESDDAFRARGQQFFVNAQRGTNGAIANAALSIGGIRTATPFEVLDALGRPAKFVQLIISDPYTDQFANLDVVPPTYQTQSQAFSTSVFSALSNVRPAGTYVQVIVASTIMQPVLIALSFLAGVDVDTAALMARAAIVNTTNALGGGGTWDYNAMIAALKLVPGLAFPGTQIVSPSGNVLAKPLQVIRTTLGIVAAVAAQGNNPIVSGLNPDSAVLTNWR